VANDIIRKLESLVPELTEALGQASSLEELEELRVRFLGRKGRLAELMSGLTALSPEERPAAGKAANQVKGAMTSLWEERAAALKVEQQQKALDAFDFSVPSWQPDLGSLHPVTRVTREICSVFTSLGFEVVSGPEVENDFNNFEALNLPPEHPARDMQDTLYISDSILLRTHTSPLQVRTMLARKPPLGVVAPGKVYRRDSDITHTPMFHQVEGLLVDTHVTMADLRGILTAFVQTVFSHDTKVRFRPSFFPFTEPSAEVDISCVICCGMVDPAVFEKVGYDPEVYTGFAFGLGVERIAMLKYGIGDLRMFFENDLRFLRQFA
jgi:phenylalanyl-tRNA synthetase alpha chain